jgi:GNAT superfamily N-acetyltransferase
MPNEITIETAVAEDVPAITRLFAHQLHEHRIEFQEDILRTAIETVIADDRLGFILVAKNSAESVGVAYVSFTWSLEHGGKSAWLEELYVVPEWREQGIGTAILAMTLDRARFYNCAALDLEIDQQHQRAANLYLRHGFQPLSRNRWVKQF